MTTYGFSAQEIDWMGEERETLLNIFLIPKISPAILLTYILYTFALNIRFSYLCSLPLEGQAFGGGRGK